MKNFLLLVVTLTSVAFSSAALANSGSTKHPKDIAWNSDGVFGTFDRPSIQRGYQVYNDACSACHSLRLISYRNLINIGFTEEEVKKIASEKIVIDGPNDEGEMFERPGRLSDRFVSPFPNEKAARAANMGAFPVDLSLIVKARPNGEDYLYSLLTGYEDEAPHGVTIADGKHYNPYFPSGGQISMSPPLFEGIVEYLDGTPATVDTMARDIAAFLQWTAEPEMEARKSMGIKVILFLIIFTILFIAAKRRVWKKA